VEADERPAPSAAEGFGALLRSWRQRAGLTQERLAERAAVSVRAIRALENGRAHPRPATVRLLGAALGLDMTDRAQFDAAARQPSADPGSVLVAAASRRPTGGVVPAQLPADVAGFAGRDRELRALDALLPGDGQQAGGRGHAVVISTIAGTAGVGKTALAVHWAHRVRERFGHGQLYVDLQGYAQGPPLSPLQALAQLLVALGVAADGVPIEVGQAAGLYRSLLADRRALVVLDNARDAGQVRPLIPGAPGCLVVVTSRDRLGGLVASHGARRLTLDGLAPDEAVSLLGQLLGQDRVAAEADAAAQLAEACGYLPLALRIAAANLTGQPHQSISSYLSRLRAGDRLVELAVDGDPDAGVRSAFDCSYGVLAPDVQRLFRLLGLIPGPELTAQAAAALAGMPAGQAGRMLERLAGAHLLEPRAPGRFGFHDLLRRYARQRGGRQDGEQERQRAIGRLLDWYLHSADAAAEVLYPDKLRLPIPEVAGELPVERFDGHAAALQWLEEERSNLVAAVQHAAAHGPQPTAWLLADTLRGYFWLRRHTVDWLVVARAGLTAATSAGAVRGQAATQLSLGHAQAALGRYHQALQHYSDALLLARRAGWTNGQAEALSELGLGHWWLGNLRQAADHHTQALVVYRQTGRHGGQATALLHLGVATRYLGRLQEAADHQTQALALYRQLGSRQGEAQALGNLGATDHELGRFDRAHQHLTRALALLQEVGNRFGQAYILCSLAAVDRDAGRYAQALEAAQAALTLAGEISHRYIQAVAGNTLASIHLCLGHHQEALDHHRQALDLTHETATRAPEVDALLGVAAVCHQTGHHPQAIDHAQRARAIANQAGLLVLEGRAHTTSASAHHALGQHHQALTHAEQALDLHRRTGHRLDQARTLRVLGLVLRDTDGVRAAVPCWQEALDLFTDIGSPEADGLRRLLERRSG
jgi:tetratricopeptide (TPR) repeat protein/transcriptional regulator with XRE-family HTH domain